MDISLVICTCNRADQLRQTLKSLEALHCQSHWEVLVVNNASTDHTQQVLDAFSARTKLPLTVLYEPIRGISAARNCGITHSRGKIVAFTDDDCYPAPDYLDAILQCMADPLLGYCSGRLLLFDPDDLPISIQTHPARRDMPAHSMVAAGWAPGANTAVRRQLLFALNGYDERIGAGTEFKAGEDTDMVRRLSWAGWAGRYDPAITIYHHHQRRQQSDADLLSRHYDIGEAAIFAKFCLYAPTRRRYLKHLYWHLRTQRLVSIARQLFYGFKFAVRLGFSGVRAWQHPAEALKRPLTNTAVTEYCNDI